MEVARVLTLNLWGEQAPLERRLELVIEACRELQPDVIGLQEVRSGTVPNTAETIARALGYDFTYETATPWGGGDEGLALVTRLPIARRGFVELPHAVPAERRIVLGAAVATPLGELCAFTTHLNYRLTDGAKREDQVAAVDAFVSSWASPLPKLLVGDFNAVPHSDEIRFLCGLHTHAGRRTFFQDAWERRHSGEKGFTWSAANPYTARLGWLDPDRRLDYIFVSPLYRDGRGSVRDCRIVLDRPASDGVYASDHFGLFAEITIAPAVAA